MHYALRLQSIYREKTEQQQFPLPPLAGSYISLSDPKTGRKYSEIFHVRLVCLCVCFLIHHFLRQEGSFRGADGHGLCSPLAAAAFLVTHLYSARGEICALCRGAELPASGVGAPARTCGPGTATGNVASCLGSDAVTAALGQGGITKLIQAGRHMIAIFRRQ